MTKPTGRPKGRPKGYILRRTQKRMLGHARAMGYEEVEYSDDFTTIEHRNTGARIQVPATKGYTQLPSAQWQRIYRSLFDGALRRGE